MPAAAQTENHRPHQTAGCRSSQQAITFYRAKYREHRAALGLPGPVPRVWYRDCKAVTRRADMWRARAKQASEAVARWRLLPMTNDWRTSVRLSQRIYPGTADWLLFISHREGGWGPFVMNHQGSGAGGWLQFMASTFYTYVDDARADTRRRGFIVPDSVWTWTHPLGQALTGAYMRYTGRDGCHWCL